MKKLFTLVAVAGMFTFFACGPSAEEKAAMEKAKQDSIAAVEAAKAQAMADSTAAYAAAEEAKAKATADSIAAATAAAEAAKTAKPAAKPKTNEQKVKEEAKKATSGRG